MIVSRTAFRLLRYFSTPKTFGITESASGGLMPLKPILLTLDFMGGFSG